MLADDHLRAGDIQAARAELVATLKRAPSDQGARMFLFQLLCLCGEWDKALTHLKALAQLSPEAQMLATVYGQAIAAEGLRAQAYAGRAPFPVLVASSPWIEGVAAAFAVADPDAAATQREAAFEAAVDTPGEVDGRRFHWVADVDPRLGPCFEAIVMGRWGLIPFEAVQRIKPDVRRDLRDLVWLPVELTLRSGQGAAALLPARYPGTETASDALRLGRQTDWINDSPLGQRVWSLDDGSEFGLLDFQELVMA